MPGPQGNKPSRSLGRFRAVPAITGAVFDGLDRWQVRSKGSYAGRAVSECVCLEEGKEMNFFVGAYILLA